MNVAPSRMLVLAAALFGAPASAFADATATATATASTQILEPAGVAQAAAGSSAAAIVGPGPGVAQISGGSFSIQGPANQVVSVSTTLPSTMQRVGGGQALRLPGGQANASRILSPAGAATFDVAGAAPVAGAAGGLYAGAAEVLVNLN
jgi:hypothetical protein